MRSQPTLQKAKRIGNVTTHITQKCFVSLFNVKTVFFLLPDLSTFVEIVGLDLLTQAGASLCLVSGQLKWGTEVEPISFHSCTNVKLLWIAQTRLPRFKVFLFNVNSQ